MEKQILVTLLLTLLSGALYSNMGVQNEDLRSIYEEWKVQNHKKYGNAESSYRFEVFSMNHKLIEENNRLFKSGQSSVELGHNQFSDLTYEEFESKYLTKKSREQVESSIFKSGRKLHAPSSIDHRDSGIVGEVVNQGSCGSCWAFSAAGSVQSALRQSGKKEFNPSQQEIIDCVVGEDYESDGCDGGFSRDGIVYVSRHGITSEEEYAYKGAKGECQRDQHSNRHKVKGYIHVNQNDTIAFVEALAIRPLSAAVNAGGIWFQLYKSGIYSRSCDGSWDKLNHEIVVVGYAPDYYIIKNSWGATWGEQGYIRFARIAAVEGQCGVHQDAGYPDV